MTRELKLLFAGPMGAGKTTAIRAISDVAPVNTEAENLDRARHGKAETTVGLDYGETLLEGGEKLRLYGLPGQDRFDFMWKILSRGALGVVLLADNGQAEGAAQLDPYLDAFGELAHSGSMVIGVGRLAAGNSRVADYAAALRRRGLRLPVFAVDVRRREDVLLLLEALLQQIEAWELVNS
jgi:signal recognition particle receptor subunit beta